MNEVKRICILVFFLLGTYAFAADSASASAQTLPCTAGSYSYSLFNQGQFSLGFSSECLSDSERIQSYSLIGDLPAGLFFDSNTGEISGFPIGPITPSRIHYIVHTVGGSFSVAYISCILRNEFSHSPRDCSAYLTQTDHEFEISFASQTSIAPDFLTPKFYGNPLPVTGYSPNF